MNTKAQGNVKRTTEYESKRRLGLTRGSAAGHRVTHEGVAEACRTLSNTVRLPGVLAREGFYVNSRQSVRAIVARVMSFSVGMRQTWQPSTATPGFLVAAACFQRQRHSEVVVGNADPCRLRHVARHLIVGGG